MQNLLSFLPLDPVFRPPTPAVLCQSQAAVSTRGRGGEGKGSEINL